MEEDVGEKKEDIHGRSAGGCGSPTAKRPKRLMQQPQDDDDEDSDVVGGADTSSVGVLAPIRPGLLSQEAVDELSQRYASAFPYPHLIVENFLDRAFLDACVTEIKDHSKVDFKESDLFKFYQSMDLASLGAGTEAEASVAAPAAADVPHVVKLRELLYSTEWRRTVEKILGLRPGTLTAQVDCACNCHADTCHLLCHDDVIRTRRVSYILYLVDDEWGSGDGGALELYASAPSKDGIRVPEPFPCASLTPKYNALCLFGVEPGVSFHSVQEVTCTRGPRLSLQGWYHSSDGADSGGQQATLRQLKTMRDESGSREDDGGDGVYQGYEDDAADGNGSDRDSSQDSELSRRDREYLSRYLDPSYLQPRALREMRERFESTSSLQLRGFFLKTLSDPAQSVLLAEDRELAADASTSSAAPINPSEFYRRGLGAGWSAVGPPHMRRYLRYESPEVRGSGAGAAESKASTSGAVLSDLRGVLQSSAFARFLERATGLASVTGHRSEIRRFRPGRDYTVAHYGLLRPECVLDATLVFCAGTGDPVAETAPDSDPDVQWQSGDVGGFECYVEVDETGEDEKYKSSSLTQAEDRSGEQEDDEDDTELLSVSAANNTLSLVYRDPGTMRFVKYVSSRAPSSRWDIAMEYRVEPSDGDDDEEGDDDDDENEDCSGGDDDSPGKEPSRPVHEPDPAQPDPSA